MTGVLIGFAIIAAIVALGWLIGRIDLLGHDGLRVLNRFAFFVLSPALLFTILARANVEQLFARDLPIAAISAVGTMAVFLVVAFVVWRRPVPEAIIGALASGYANGQNIGVPVSVYVLGSAAASTPVILLQLIILAPIALTLLDLTTSGKASLGRILLQPVKNPLIVGSLLGLICSLLHWLPPDPVMAPFDLVGAAAVPVILISFGMSLSGSRVLQAGTYRKDSVLAILLKLFLMPLLAWALARFVFGMEGHELFVATVLGALPSAQNVFTFALRYNRGIVIARDVVLITTLASVAVLVVIAALLAD